MKQKPECEKQKAVYMMCVTRKVNALDTKPECAEMHSLPCVGEPQSTGCSGSQNLCMWPTKGGFLAGNSSRAVWWLRLWWLPGHSQLNSYRDIEESRAVGLSPGASRPCVPKHVWPKLAWWCCRGTFRDIVAGTSWVLLWMMVAEGAWGPRAARVGPEGL